VAKSDIRGFACCNELYEYLPLVEGFRALRSIGYDAVEVEPHTFGQPVFSRSRDAERSTLYRADRGTPGGCFLKSRRVTC